jgi:Na+-translocating ferredoxin:NAD+ oxidoreductase RNF subunit RnfB
VFVLDVGTILYPVAAISGMGLLFGLGLGYAGKVFAVKEDERIALIRGALPGANCGGCGFPGCDQLALAIAEGRAKHGACPVGGETSSKAIAEIMGAEAGDTARAAAFVKCSGRNEKAARKYEYAGLADCRAMTQLPAGGPKACAYGCLGGGDCARACPFDAIFLRDGLAAVDKEKCVACGVCVAACPRALIELVPVSGETRVACSSKAPGKEVRQVCAAGCIGCKLCEKACDYGAVKVTDNLSVIDYAKCVNCGACALKCPTKVIKQDARREG